MAAWDIFSRRAAFRALGLVAVLVGVGATPGSLAGQALHDLQRGGAAPARSAFLDGERLRFEPWGGVLWDAYRNDGGNGAPAWIGAARLAYEIGGRPASFRRWRMIAEVGRAEAAEAGTATLEDSLLVGFRTEWWLTTAGVEWDAIDGWMGLTLEAQGGAAWIEREIVGGDSIPSGTPGTSDRAEPEPFPTAVVGVSGFRYLTHRVQLRVRVQDVVTDLFDAREHSPALGVGLRFVFE